MIIEIEGIDGVGKTTQSRLLKNWLESCGERAVIVKDLESTRLGKQIKAVLATDTPRTKEVELFGFLCCKAHLFAETIRHAIADGVHVICDRGIGSFLSYFEVLGFERTFLIQMLEVALPDLRPSKTVLLDLDVQEALRRNVAKSACSKFDSMGGTFFANQRRIYQELAYANQWIVISGSDSIDAVHRAIVSVME